MTEKQKLVDAICSMATTYIKICEYKKFITILDEEKKICDKHIRLTKKFINIVKNVNHIEILESIYRTFIGGKEVLFAIMVATGIKKETIRTWDKSKKGFETFLKLEEEAIKKTEEEKEEARKQKEFIENAKKEGKKIEFVYEDGKAKPVIAEEKAN